jgi:hypothetical protein
MIKGFEYRILRRIFRHKRETGSNRSIEETAL